MDRDKTLIEQAREALQACEACDRIWKLYEQPQLSTDTPARDECISCGRPAKRLTTGSFALRCQDCINNSVVGMPTTAQ